VDALVDIYLAYHRIRAEIRTTNFDRVSDLLNSSQGRYLSGTSQLISDVTQTPWKPWRPISSGMVALVSDIRFLDPIEESSLSPARPERIRARTQVAVELLLDAWQVTGVLHLMDRVPWPDFLHAARGRFLPLSGARAQLAGSQSAVHSELLLINGSYISAIHA
jgi:hypothetical protein